MYVHSMVWPTLGSRMAKEQNRTAYDWKCETYMHLVDSGYVGSRLALDIQLGEDGLQRMTPNRGLVRNRVPNGLTGRCLSAMSHARE